VLRFTQDFEKDLVAFAEAFFAGERFAFSRYGDGEWRLGAGEMVRNEKAHEIWWSHRYTTRSRGLLRRALGYSEPGYYVGISSCHPKATPWLRSRVRVPLYQTTFATLFCHANYDAFLDLDLRRHSVLVSSAGGDFAVPKNAVNTEWDLDGLIAELGLVTRPILVAAGPAACWIVHRYWVATPAHKRQAIIDVGAAYDPEIHGENTRDYHDPNHGWRKHRCKW
jgi:hypothetical protein